MRQASSVVYFAIDQLLPSRTRAAPELEHFLDTLSQAAIPCVWLTCRTRLQIDEPRRKLGHRDPFIAEDGCGVFLPEDYFHLRPEAPRSAGSKQGRPKGTSTIRLGRFTCLPVAEPQPAADEALQALAEETSVSVVPLRSLPPRELAQNAGLLPREAELTRQRDFDELFFFAGATTAQIDAFKAAAQDKQMQLRQEGALWSLALGADTGKCVRELGKLYDRALHAHAKIVGIAVGEQPPPFLSACDRAVLLTQTTSEEGGDRADSGTKRGRVLRVPLQAAKAWEQLSDYLVESR